MDGRITPKTIYTNFSSSTVGSDQPTSPGGLRSTFSKRPGSSIFDKGGDSLASKTLYQPSIQEKKGFMNMKFFGGSKKEAELNALREKQRETELQLQRLADQQKERDAWAKADHDRREEEARQARKRERDRDLAEKKRLRDIEIEAEKKRVMQLQSELEYEREVQERRRTTTPEALRNLRELIRTRYELDMEIFRMRNVRGPDRPLVFKKMQRSDAVLAEIQAIVATWEPNDDIWEEEEWKLAEDVKRRLGLEKMRHWGNKGPWTDDGKGNGTY